MADLTQEILDQLAEIRKEQSSQGKTLASVETMVTNIGKTVDDHGEDIDSLKTFRTSLRAQMTMVAALVGAIFGLLSNYIGNFFTGQHPPST